jgi:hypothetical protein
MKKSNDIRDIIVLVMVIAIMLIFTSLVSISAGYKMGQVDCANGKMYYKLTEQPDGTTSWEPIHK